MRRIPVEQPGFYGMYTFVIVIFCCLRRFESQDAAYQFLGHGMLLIFFIAVPP